MGADGEGRSLRSDAMALLEIRFQELDLLTAEMSAQGPTKEQEVIVPDGIISIDGLQLRLGLGSMPTEFCMVVEILSLAGILAAESSAMSR